MADASTIIAALSIIVAVAAVRSARRARRQLERSEHDYRLRVKAAVRTLDEFDAANRTLQKAVQQREQAIADLLNRLNAAAVERVVVQRMPMLGLPVNRVSPSKFNRN